MDRVEFVGAVAEPGRAPPADLPQVAFAGRSNVGKSSLINLLTGRKGLARVSRSPGRTQQINFFDVDGAYLLADLPGYGFALAPDEVRRAWGPLVESYLAGSPGLLGVVLLLDARRGVTPDDRRMLEYLARTGLPTLYALTKIDKLKRSERRAAIEGFRKELAAPADQIVVTSARTGEGRKELERSVRSLVEHRGGRE